MPDIGVPPKGWGAIAFVLAGGLAAQLGAGLVIAYALASCGVYLSYLVFREAQ